MWDPGDWHYRAEGNSSLVIAHNDFPYVLRLQKIAVTDGDKKEKECAFLDDAVQGECLTSVGQLDESEILRENSINRSLQFASDVMLPVIGSEYVSPGCLITLPDYFLNSIRLNVEKSRPPNRRKKVLTIGFNSATLLPDFCVTWPQQISKDPIDGFLPSFISKLRCFRFHTHPTGSVPKADAVSLCVEIKPKCGFRPSNTRLYPIKKSVCRYCMHQVTKLKDEQIGRLSAYCPLDLFSGVLSRTRRAIRALFEDPQNNLRVFYAREQVFGDKLRDTDLRRLLTTFMFPAASRSSTAGGATGASTSPDEDVLEMLGDVIVEALWRRGGDGDVVRGDLSSNADGSAPRNDADVGANCRRKTRCLSEGVPLPPGCILERVLSAQKLDALPIEDILMHYETLEKNSCLFRDQDGPYNTESWAAIRQNVNDSLETDDGKLLHIRRFLIAQTAKDCSIFISFPKVASSSLPPSDSSQTDSSHNCGYNSEVSGEKKLSGFGSPYRFAGEFIFSVHVVDLDPKDCKRIPKYFEDDEIIVKTYENYLKE
ncbi:PREDICTED: inositol-pentakisphosphate 2-kinase-like [Priapulus caudatus]|uniref:Inositol-pentakisphosphate 2-kinase n=1 Tax=Priapulus caudatus TaxID=37621 RepID=A0ABM1ED09_PRICU|nr:PREDICTED: inositol-pentakisphosphate 2-kinase-like [Priapulus caudatus]XP_014670080.1 PREDICTED: inositol-pentakisphosphate 2-kinase-like [Priapulus caudatus]